MVTERERECVYLCLRVCAVVQRGEHPSVNLNPFFKPSAPHCYPPAHPLPCLVLCVVSKGVCCVRRSRTWSGQVVQSASVWRGTLQQSAWRPVAQAPCR